MDRPKLPTLVVAGGPHDGTAVAIEGLSVEKVLGSAGTSHARLPAGNVAATHARIVWDQRGIVVSDEGSETGTYVNGERIGDEHVLNDGDRLFLGPPGSKDSVKMLVMIPPEAMSHSPMSIGMAPADDAAHEPIVLDADSESEPLVLEPEPPRSTGQPLDLPPVQLAVPDPPVASPTRPPPSPSTPSPPSAGAASGHGAAPVRPAASPALPSPAAGTPPKKPVRPEYTTEPPSIAPARPRDAPAAPPVPAIPLPAPRRPPPSKRISLPEIRLPELPKGAWFGIGAAVLAIAGFFVYRSVKPPTPVVTSVTPSRVEPGQVVTIVGNDFAPTPAGNTVRFGDEVGQVTGATETQLTVTVPESLRARAPADVSVVVRTGGGSSGATPISIFVTPKVLALEPDVALPGQEVAARGQNLSGSAVTVQVGGFAATVVEAGPTTVRFKMPEELPSTQGKNVDVVVSTGKERTLPVRLTIGRLPLLLDVTPVSGPAGSRVTLKGRGFEADPSANVVRFSGQTALVLKSSPTELVVAAPGLASAQSQAACEIAVQVRGGSWTNALAFTLSRPSSQSYSPRYFAAPSSEHAGHDHIFVANELGPVLLLTGKADAPSTAERAIRTADALNGLMANVTTTTPFALEVRESSVPAVVGPGAKVVVVTATPEDAAAYDEPWLGGKASRRGTTAKALAAYWRALLQDHIALFRQGQRPYLVLELTPRGRVLRDLYREARRGSSSGFLPVSALPLPEPHSKALRELAVSLPTGENVSAGAAVEGLWEGSADEGGGAQPVRVRFRLDGSRLAGSLTSKVRNLSVETSLTNVLYDKGTVQFTLSRGTAPRYFSGVLEGTTLTGTVLASPTAKDALGRFTLRFVE